MAADGIRLTFYHSAVCPRCRLTGLILRSVLRRHPEIELTRVEFLTNRSQARRDGVRAIPALVADGRRLSGFLLTRGRIERFLASLET